MSDHTLLSIYHHLNQAEACLLYGVNQYRLEFRLLCNSIEVREVELGYLGKIQVGRGKPVLLKLVQFGLGQIAKDATAPVV